MSAQALLITMQEWFSNAQRLHQLMERQSKALMVRDVMQVDTLRPQIESLFGLLAQLDKQRNEQCGQLASEFETEPKLKKIMAFLTPAEKKAIHALISKSERLVEAIQYSLIKNRALLENELVYIEGTLSLIAQAAQESTPYGHGKAPSVWVNETV